MTDSAFHTLPGDITGKFDILQELGEGGMGTVYKVRHRHLDEILVIKIIHARLARDEGAKARFVREARLAKQLRHDNIARLIDFDVASDGTAYIVTEFIEGSDLREVIHASERGLHHRVATQIMTQVLDGLSAIHEKGFIHRDISPDNIMVTPLGGQYTAKLIDLGLARSVTGTATTGGAFAGKAHYASPEQFGGLNGLAVVDSRSDLYSVGVVLYELLTHTHPIGGTSYASIVAGHLTRPPRDFSETDPENVVPLSLRPVVLKALEKNPARRYQTATELADALREAVASHSAAAAETPVSAEPAVIPAPAPSGRAMAATMVEAVIRRVPKTTTKVVVASIRQRLPPFTRDRTIIVASLVAIVALAGLTYLTSRALRRDGTVLVLRPRVETARRALATPLRATTPQPPPVTETLATVEPAAPVLLPPPPLAGTMAEPLPGAATDNSNSSAAKKNRRSKRVEPQPEVIVDTSTATATAEPAPAPAPPPSNRQVAKYVVGGDRGANRSALADLKRELVGVNQVAVVGSGDVELLRTELSKGLGPIAIASGTADVVIDYSGGLERVSRLKKRRFAHAQITKNGARIFEYSMSPETFMIGTPPAVEFANVLRRALAE